MGQGLYPMYTLDGSWVVRSFVCLLQSILPSALLSYSACICPAQAEWILISALQLSTSALHRWVSSDNSHKFLLPTPQGLDPPCLSQASSHWLGILDVVEMQHEVLKIMPVATLQGPWCLIWFIESMKVFQVLMAKDPRFCSWGGNRLVSSVEQI